ncbi:MAG: hypothetical protein HFI34_04365 [Lachnospiraceae bacterium]|nr:hypothetical protein [Lachnospiraceae bacterium]
MKKIYKRIVATIIIICLSNWCILQNYTLNYANEDDIKQLEDEMEDIVEYFYPYITLKVEKITPIYKLDKICEYAIDISADNVNYGYFIVNDSYDITRFIIKQNSDGFIESNFDILLDKKILKVDIFEYQYSDEDIVLGSYDDIFNICYDDLSMMDADHNLKCQKTLKKYYAFGENFITDKLGMDYGCAIVAMLNVAAQNQLFRVRNASTSSYDISNIKSEYKRIWDIARPIDGFIAADKMGSIMSAYVKKYHNNFTLTYKNYSNPPIGFFTNAIDANYSAILGVVGDVSGAKSGHAFSVIGYLNYQHRYKNHNKTFLKVTTGWGYDNEIGYIDYNNLNVRSTYGVKYIFK